MSSKPKAFDWFLLACLVVCWGLSFSMSKVALRTITPEWIAAARLVIGAGILLLATAAQRKPIATDARSMGIYVWLGLVGNAAPFFIITWGMQFIPSGVAGLLMGTIPLVILVMAHFTLPGERLTPSRALGFLLGFAGIIVLMGPDNLLNLKAHGQELIGELAVVAGCLLYGINSISVKRLALPGTLATSAAVLSAGAVLATAAALLQSPFTLHTQPATALLALFGLGLLPTGVATVIWFKAVERTSPTFTATSNYLVPIFALVFGAFTLNESISWTVGLALLLVLAGIFVSRRTSRG